MSPRAKALVQKGQRGRPAESNGSVRLLMLRLGGAHLRSYAGPLRTTKHCDNRENAACLRSAKARSNGKPLVSAFLGRNVVGGGTANRLSTVVKAGYEKKSHLGRLPKRVWKKKKMRMNAMMNYMEDFDNPQLDEMYRLAQEDLFQLKREFMSERKEKADLLLKMAEERKQELEQERLQLAQGNIDAATQDLYFNKKMMERYRRSLANHMTNLQAEFNEMDARKSLKDDEETKRKRRAKAFDVDEWDRSRGYSNDIIEIPDEEEYLTTPATPPTLEDKVMHEMELSRTRVEGRLAATDAHWSKMWAIQDPKTEKPGMSYFTRALKRYPSLRRFWEDDGRCWREYTEWHTHYTSSQRVRATDGVLIPSSLVEAAHKTTLELWRGCPDIPPERPMRLDHISNCASPPSIAPSVWTYPGNMVCLMNRRGQLDIYRRRPVDRDLYWQSSFSLAKDFLKRIPDDYDLSAVPVGENHIAFFSFQRYFVANRTPSPFGHCWMVPKAELSKGTNVVELPAVPLRYYKPFSAKDTLFVIGYDSPSDKHYQILALEWNNGGKNVAKDAGNDDGAKAKEVAARDSPSPSAPTPTWKVTPMNNLPIEWSASATIQDYPESIHLEGTAMICKTFDDSHIFIMAPSKTGMSLAIIDTTTWDFHRQEVECPPVWGAAMMHDPIHDTLILAGGIGVLCPEPIVRTLYLGDFSWSIDRTAANNVPLPAYAASFPLGHGSFGIIGGFWRTGQKAQNLQPTASIITIHTTPLEEFQENYFIQKYHYLYKDPEPGDALTEEAAGEATEEDQLASGASDEVQFEE